MSAALNMNPFPDLSGGLDECIPVTVMLTPAQAARLEVLTANLRAMDPAIDDNDVTDAVFETGLAALDTPFAAMEIAR